MRRILTMTMVLAFTVGCGGGDDAGEGGDADVISFEGMSTVQICTWARTCGESECRAELAVYDACRTVVNTDDPACHDSELSIENYPSAALGGVNDCVFSRCIDYQHYGYESYDAYREGGEPSALTFIWSVAVACNSQAWDDGQGCEQAMTHCIEGH
jgi:hypothetical protein